MRNYENAKEDGQYFCIFVVSHISHFSYHIMKKSDLTFSVVLVPIDYIMILLAGMSAYFLRYSQFYQENIREIVFDLPFGGYLATVFAVGIFWVGIFALLGLYTIGARRKFIDEFSKIIVGCRSVLAIAIDPSFF